MKVTNTGLDCFFPCKSVKLHANDKPWVTPEFKEIIENRKKAYLDGKSKSTTIYAILQTGKRSQGPTISIRKWISLTLTLTSKSGGIA